MDIKQLRRDLINEVAKGIAYKHDHKKKSDEWDGVLVGVYGTSAFCIVDEYIMPVLEKHKLLEGEK